MTGEPKYLMIGGGLSFDHRTQEWSIFESRFKQFCMANDINDTTDKAFLKRRALLLTSLVEDTYRIAKDLAFPVELEDLEYKVLLEKISTHFVSKKSSFAERYKFYKAEQRPGEDLAEWAARVRSLAQYCGFKLELDTALRDRFVLGLENGKEKEKLFSESIDSLTFNKALELAQSVRCARMAVQGSSGGASTAAAQPVFALRSTPSKSNDDSGTKKCCVVCGYKNHTKEKCRFVNYTCQKCHQKGHLKRVCKSDLKSNNFLSADDDDIVQDVKTILKSVSGRLRSGELTAIMGPSGAGKSTLLNILTGYRTSGMEGSITVNGMERNLSSFRKLSCYIMQDNQLHGNLTVEEAMAVATALKLPTANGQAHKDVVIQEILETLGLSEHHKTMTSNLSGGQKKRLSIALELVNNPPIMFFDEPTSGLDSSSCFQCISLLKNLASEGRTIICTIHQPSARLFEMFDHLYTLADGQCVYQGSTGRLVEWLGSLNLACPSYHNPASFIIEVSCGEYGDNTGRLVRAIDNGKNDIRNGLPFPENNYNNRKDMDASLPERNKNDLSQLQEKFTEPPDSNGNGNLQNGILQYAANEVAKGKGEPLVVQMELEKQDNAEAALLGEQSPRRYATSELKQFWVVLKRTLLFSRRDWTLMYLRLFAHILVGFLIGALYYDIGNDGSKVLSNLGFLFFNMLFLMYTSMTITILSFPLEMPVLIKEHFNRWYSLRSYYLAITVSDIPFQAIFCVIYVVIVYLLTSQPAEWFRFSLFLSSCLLISFVAQSVGLVVGAAMNVQNGVFLAPVMSVPFLLFSGFFVSFNAIPKYLRWITYLSYIRYGFEGTALATYSFDRPKLKCHQAYCHFKNPSTTLEELDMLEADITLDIAALCLIFVVLRISAFLFLRWKLKSTR